MAARTKTTDSAKNGATLGFEAKLWPAADTFRNDPSAGFVLANGSMTANPSGEGDIRRALIEADLVDCMVALPIQLFYSTQKICLN